MKNIHGFTQKELDEMNEEIEIQLLAGRYEEIKNECVRRLKVEFEFLKENYVRV